MNKTKRLGVSSKLTIWIGLMIVFMLITTTLVSYYQSKNISFELLKENQLKVMHDVQTTFDNYASARMRAIEVLAKKYGANPDMQIEEMVSLLSSVKDISGFNLTYVGFEQSEKTFLSNGSMLDPSKNFDTKNTIWFKQARDSGKIISTNPYHSVDSNAPTLTYAAPFYKDGKFRGVVAGDYDIKNFSKDVLTLGHGNNSYASVYDADGNIIFNEDQAKILTKNTLSINIKNALANDPRLLDPNVRDTLFYADNDKGETQAIMCTPSLTNPSLRICSVLEKKIYDDISNSVLYRQCAIGFSALIIILII
ncbi:cache domain-containing protein, partial [Campylobacter taeniopygiae]|uniref:cache domain-containing protein n=1 Tax=Campylobacter taeniopygiae TaxID=2510188 RepID=UPI003D6BD6BA